VLALIISHAGCILMRLHAVENENGERNAPGAAFAMPQAILMFLFRYSLFDIRHSRQRYDTTF